MRSAGFDRVWFACKACPIPEVALEVTAAGAGLLLTSAPEANRLNRLFAKGVPWGFAVSSEERRRDLLWVLRRWSPKWVSLGDEESLAILYRQGPHDPDFPLPRLLLRLRPPRTIRTACGYYGFDPQELRTVICHPRFSGLHFHIGSNKSGGASYLRLLDYARQSWESLPKSRVDPPVINLGGGFAVSFTHFDALAARARHLFPDSQIWVEPGRFLVQRSLFWVARTTVRNDEIFTEDPIPVSTEARRNPPRLKGFLRSPSAEWVPLSAEVIGERRLRIISVENSSQLRGQESGVFYDCAAYHWLPSAPLVIV